MSHPVEACILLLVGGAMNMWNFGIYSGYGKYSDPFKFFTLCFIAAIILFLINVHSAPHLDRKKQKCRNFCKVIKKEKLKYHMAISIQTLCCDTHI